MDYLPLSLGVKDRRVLLVGGGKVAAQKFRLLAQTSARITVVAPEILPEIIDSGVECRLREFTPADARGCLLVYACTADRELNRRIAATARAEGALVNTVDDPAASDFVSPAVHRSSNMTVAVGSDARDVNRSVAWRNRIAEFCRQELEPS